MRPEKALKNNDGLIIYLIIQTCKMLAKQNVYIWDGSQKEQDGVLKPKTKQMVYWFSNENI